MFGLLTTGYLFLGGAGAGALVVLGALELANAGRASRAFPLSDEFFARTWPLCSGALALGLLCLFADVGRPERVLNLLFSPTFSAITIGAYALAIALACAAFFTAASLFDGLRASVGVARAVAAVGMVAGAATMVYTGVLLAGMASVLVWQTLLLPTLFVLSSLSCGIACVFFGAVFVEERHPHRRPLGRLARIDEALIAAELIVLALFVGRAWSGAGTHPAAEALVAGEFAWLFWVGLVACGLCAPAVLELFLTDRNYRTQLLWIAVLVLVGGFILRFCVVGVASFDATQIGSGLVGAVAGAQA